MRKFTIALIVGFIFFPLTAIADPDMDKNVDLMVRLCIAGGHTETTNGNVGGDANISLRSLDVHGNLKGDLKITKSNAEGLVNGIDNAISALAASQADKVRDCLKPVRDRLIEILFPTPQGKLMPPPNSDKLAKRNVNYRPVTTFSTQWQKMVENQIQYNNKTRLWKKIKDHWEESLSDGSNVMYHDTVSRISLNGCDGEKTVKEEDKKLEFFIPEIGCKNMTLMFRFNDNAWMPFGIMANYH